MSADPTRPLPEWWQTEGPPEPREQPGEPSGAHAGGHARIPVIWLAELFTPTTIPNLIGGLRKLTGSQSRPRPRGGDYDFLVEWITSDRRRGGSGNWYQFPLVRPTGSRLGDNEVVDQVPAGIEYIQLEVRTLTSTVTALTALFGLDDDSAQGVSGHVVCTSFGSVRCACSGSSWR
jgi:hypothetical protein